MAPRVGVERPSSRPVWIRAGGSEEQLLRVAHLKCFPSGVRVVLEANLDVHSTFERQKILVRRGDQTKQCA